MPAANVNGLEIYYESTGSGYPVLFSHEYAGDSRSWDAQVSFFHHAYRCITYNHRGYPPSAVPQGLEAYSQDLLIDDLLGLVRHLAIPRAHFVGLSMGASVVLNFALRYPERCSGIVVAGCGTGSGNRERFERDVAQIVSMIRDKGMESFANSYAGSPTRALLREKRPESWREFCDRLGKHPAISSSMLMEGVLLRRPTIFSLKDSLNRCEVPSLVLTGDEDGPCVDPAVFMKREMPSAGLLVLPRTGHTVNLEEPEMFNDAVMRFFRAVEAGTWGNRRPRGAVMLPD